MLSHITLGTDDLPRAMAFYDPVLATLGLSLRFREEHWAGGRHPTRSGRCSS